ASRDDDVRTGIERLRDRSRAEIEIGRDDLRRIRQNAAAGLAGREFTYGEPAGEIVALDDGDAWYGKTLLARERKDHLRRFARIGATEIADDPDALAQAVGQHGTEEALKRRIV